MAIVLICLWFLGLFLFTEISEEIRRERHDKEIKEFERQREEEMKTFDGFKKHFVAYSTDDTPEKAWKRLKE